MAQEKNLHEIFRHNSFTCRAYMPQLQGRRYLHFRTSSEPISPLSICFCDRQRERQRERGSRFSTQFSEGIDRIWSVKVVYVVCILLEFERKGVLPE
jgi:hypothetical protein